MSTNVMQHVDPEEQPDLATVSYRPTLDSENLSEHTISPVEPRVSGGFLNSVLSFLEGPWAPSPEDLPAKRTPEMTGNSSEPFRQPATREQKRVRKQEVREIERSVSKEQISRWSTLYSYDVPVKGLAPDLENTRVLHLSDIHFLEGDPRAVLELQNFASWLKGNQEHFDLLLISGDILTKGPEDLTPAGLQAIEEIASCATISAYVPGNHDYHGAGNLVLKDALEKINIIDLTNVHLRFKRGDDFLNIYGVDDSIFGSPYEPQVLNGDEAAILLTHNLDAVRSNFQDSFDLILSGHTHWGEVRFLNGSKIMNMWGYCDNHNQHTLAWDKLTDRALSYVHPGLARYYARLPILRHPPGFVVHNLTTATDEK
jgi:predicted MPP superfamily phosphohydrolase